MSAGQAAAGRRVGWGSRRSARAPRGAPRRCSPPRLRRWLMIALAASLVLAAGYRFWLRDSSLVAVEQVSVSGLTTKDAARVRAALAPRRTR